MAKAKVIPQALKDKFEVSELIPGRFEYKGKTYVTESMTEDQAQGLCDDKNFPYINEKKEEKASSSGKK